MVNHWLIMVWLVVSTNPSEKNEFVNGKDDIPYMKWKIIHSWLKPPTSMVLNGQFSPWFRWFCIILSIHDENHGLAGEVTILMKCFSESLPGYFRCVHQITWSMPARKSNHTNSPYIGVLDILATYFLIWWFNDVYIFSRLPTPFVLIFFGGDALSKKKNDRVATACCHPAEARLWIRESFGGGQKLEWMIHLRNIEKHREVPKKHGGFQFLQSTTVISYGQSWWANLQKIIR